MKRHLMAILMVFFATAAYAQVDSIFVDVSQRQGAVNRQLLGTNIVTPWAGSFEDLFSDTFIFRMKEMGIRRIRWPGGSNADSYNWRIHGWWRQPFPSGYGVNLSQMAQICQEIGCELQITVNFGTMNAHDAADLVRYCRDSLRIRVSYWEIGNETHHEHTLEQSWTACNPRKYYFGGSEERRGRFRPGGNSSSPGFKGDLFASDGSAHQRWLIHFPDVAPGSDSVWVGPDTTHLVLWKRVKFDTILPGDTGNYYEMDYDSSILKFGDGIKGRIPPKNWGVLCEYTSTHHDGYLTFVDSMKAVDPSIQIGSCFPPDTTWARSTLDSVFSHIDFIITHQYGPESVETEKSYYMRMIYAPKMLAALFGIRRWIDRWAGDYADSIGLAVTEWNFIIAPPIHKIAGASLASALFAAEKLGSMIENSDTLRLQIANQFNAIKNGSGQYNGLLRSGDYLQRPEAYVFKMFQEFFGDTLVKNNVECDLFQQGWRPYPYYPYLVAYASKRDNKLFLIVINKDSTRAHPTRITIENFTPVSQGIAHILTADSIYATNEENPETVTFLDSTLTHVSSSFLFPFPAHSVTALELEESPSNVIRHSPPVKSFCLENAYPNPFNASTTIKYRLGVGGRVNLSIVDLLGRIVRHLVKKKESAGEHSIIWDGKDDSGNGVGSGVYFCQLKTANGYSRTKKLLLLK